MTKHMHREEKIRREAASKRASPAPKRKKRRKRKKGHPVLIALLIFVLLIGLCLGGAYYVLNTKLNKIERYEDVPQPTVPPEEQSFELEETDLANPGEDTRKAEEIVWQKPQETKKEPKVKNILLIGQDRRVGAAETRARSDTVIICSINEDTDKITLTSLMRDMYVPIPGYYDNRFNSAFAYGGIELLDQTIEEDFGIRLDGNVEVDFEGFLDVMGLIAPLEIELKDYEVGYMNSGTTWGLHTGVNALNAEQLLTYSRIRYVGHADWERTERQRRVLTAAFNKVRSRSFAELTDLLDAALPCLRTDMSNMEILSYIYTVLSHKMTIGETYRLPVEGTYTAEKIWGMDVLVPDLEANSRYLQEYIYGKTQ